LKEHEFEQLYTPWFKVALPKVCPIGWRGQELIDVLLIEPMYSHKEKELVIRHSADFYSGSPVVIREPVAIEYIAGYLKSKGISVDIVQQTTEKDDEVLNSIEKLKPKILGISVHSTNIFPRVLNFLKLCKERFPEIITVLGGSHPTCVPEIVSENCIDYVVRGEGEETFYELATVVLKEDPEKIETIKGISSINEDGKIIHNPPRQRFDFSKAPWPIRKKEILERVKCAPLCYPPPPQQKCAAQIAYSRGCPFKCEFCISPLVFPGKVIYRDPKDVVNEIEFLQREFGTNFLFFTDLTFNANHQKLTELCDEIISRRLNIYWFAYCSMHVNDKLIKKMADAGCTRIGTGAESFIDEILEIYKSQQNLRLIEKALKIIDKFGILNRVYIMIGYPEENRRMLDETLEIMKTFPIDQPRLAFIIPFPGTSFYKQFENRMITKSLEYFTGDYPIIKNEYIPRQEYINIRNKIITEFYNSKNYMNHVIDKCERFPHLCSSFLYFIEYLKNKNIMTESIYKKLKSNLQELGGKAK